MAGVIPGLLLGLSLMALCLITARRQNFPKAEAIALRAGGCASPIRRSRGRRLRHRQAHHGGGGALAADLLLPMLVVLGLATYLPALTLWLPSLLLR
jgi:TRAP-type C4-dicarboxylate transport system permease large subunit